jgi:phenylalanyl-tRNA synthetase alpha chain
LCDGKSLAQSVGGVGAGVGCGVGFEFAIHKSGVYWAHRSDTLVCSLVCVHVSMAEFGFLCGQNLYAYSRNWAISLAVFLASRFVAKRMGERVVGAELFAATGSARCYTTGIIACYSRNLCEVSVAITEEDMLEAIVSAKSLEDLEALRVQYLGRKGMVTEQLKSVGLMPPSERAAAGKAANELRNKLEEALKAQEGKLEAGLATMLMGETFDITAPGKRLQLGHRHPVSMILDDLVDLFWQMGFQVAEGPEVETEWYNFEALLVGKDHPARDMQDTFYLEEGNLPRTHTSAVQIRHMEAHKDTLPIRIIAPGKAYRNEDEDPRHSWSFYQLEGLVVDEGVSLGDLKGTLENMMRGVLGDDTKIRLRSNYFPYTEPSVEMDATCPTCKGTGIVSDNACKLCGGTGWLELGGAGMVHPQVLKNSGIDPKRYSGFAFGFGPERIATIKYGVGDVREFWRPSLKFLEQF